MTGETWLIVGASSSIARAFAQLVAAQGHRVILTGQDKAHLDACAADIEIRHGTVARVIAFDAMALDGHAAFLDACGAEAIGTLNIFLAIASVPDDAEGAADFSAARRTVMTSYVAPISLLWHLTPMLAKQAGGRVIILGSIAGERGRDENYIYASAKAGLHVFAQGLRARLSALGVAVTTAKLGFVDTSRTWGRVPASLSASPITTARACLAAAERAETVVYIPGAWRWIALMLRLMPESLITKLATRKKYRPID